MLTIGWGSAVTSARGVRLNLSRLPSISNNVTVVSDLPKRVCMMVRVQMHSVWRQKMCPRCLSLDGLGGSGEHRE